MSDYLQYEQQREAMDHVVVPMLLAASVRLMLYATEPRWFPRLRHRQARVLADMLAEAAESPSALHSPAVRESIYTFIRLVCDYRDAAWHPAQIAKGAIEVVESWRQDIP